MRRSNERGAALFMAIFMTMLVSALGAAMVHVANTETLSTANYTSMSQARYAAESGIAGSTNYLLSSTYAATMPGTASDPITNYDITVSPVTRNGAPVVLSSDPAVASNYPVAEVVTAFQARSSGTLAVGVGNAAYTARATLLRMRQITDSISGVPVTLQTWEITGTGQRATGAIAGQVEVSAIIERATRAVFNYAAFATANGCSALTFSGNAYTNSYDSSVAVPSGSTPVLSASNGHVGTNGNLGETGTAVINGTLSTPMSGVGACTANNVTAATIGPNAQVTGGLVQLPQPVEFPTPPAPAPLPPTTNQTISGSGCPSGYTGVCAVSGSQTVFTPAGSPVLLGNLSLSGGAIVVLKAGTYHINSLTISGNAKIVVDSSAGGQVKIVLAGQGSGTNVLDVTGNGVSNTTWDPNILRIEYAGTKTVKLDGNGDTAAIIYAPNAHAALSGNADFYGTLIMRTITSTGNSGIHYDRRLQSSSITAGNPVMSTFTWRTF